MSIFTLTSENYYSPEASRAYMSVSQFKSFCKCEAAAMAEISGEYTRPKTTALLVGSYVDAHFEGTLDSFKGQNPEIFTLKGELRADYKQAEEIIARCEKDKLFMEYMSGTKQEIFTGEIDGVPFKIKIDSYHKGKMIVDLKTSRGLERIMGISLVEKFGYDTQGGVYREIEGNHLPFFLAIVTKETPVNIEIAQINQWNLDQAMQELRKKLPRIAAVKKGEAEPSRCGICPYCVSTKVLTEAIDSDLLGFSNDEIRAMRGEY